MIAFANGPEFGNADEIGTPDRDELARLKFMDMLKALSDVTLRLGKEVNRLSSTGKMHGGMELIGETDIHLVLWKWTGPGTYEVRMEPRPGVACAPQQQEHGEAPGRETDAETSAKSLAYKMGAFVARLKKLLG